MAKKHKLPSRKTASTNGKAAAVDSTQAVVEQSMSEPETEAVVADEQLADTADESEPKLDYRDAMREGKAIMALMDANSKDRQRRLEALADGVEKQYGKGKLKQFAKDINIEPCTLERYRSTYRAWPKEAPGPISR